MFVPTDIQLEAARTHWSACALVDRTLTSSGLIVNEFHGGKFVAFDRDGNVVKDRFV